MALPTISIFTKKLSYKARHPFKFESIVKVFKSSYWMKSRWLNNRSADRNARVLKEYNWHNNIDDDGLGELGLRWTYISSVGRSAIDTRLNEWHMLVFKRPTSNYQDFLLI